MPRRRLHLVADGAALRPAFDRLRAELKVPEAFDPDVLAEAAASARDPRPPLGGSRTDLTDLPFVTLDPPGATDLDQAMHLSRHGSGYLVRYAIADVSAFVRPGGAVDAEAHRRVETLYAPDRRTPLHPEVLSERAASLLPGEVRPAFVWSIWLDADGAVVESDVRRSVVQSVAQLDYPSVQRAFDAAATEDAYVLLHEIGVLRLELGRARGAISLNLADQEVIPTAEGWTLAYRSPLPCEEWNAQISLLTGTVAGELMLDGGIGVLRTMPPADPRDLARLRRTAAALGIEWRGEVDYAQLMAALDPAEPLVAAFLQEAAVLFRGAAWVGFDGTPPTVTTHAAVAAPYAHVTAPLRRLVDRYGLEICAAICADEGVPDWVRSALPTLGEEMADGVRRGNALDRGATDLVEAAILGPHVGEEFEAVVVDLREGGAVVQLLEPAVVAICDDDGGELGARVRVRLAEASIEARRVRFSWA